MKISFFIFTLLALAVAGSAGVPLWLSGADDEQLAAVTEVWPGAEVLPPGLSPDSPYPDLLPLLTENDTALLITFAGGVAGLSVSARLIAGGGYDEDLGTVHTSTDTSSYLEAVRQFIARVDGDDGSGSASSAEGTPRLSTGEIARRLNGLTGRGTSDYKDVVTDEVRRRTRQLAYDVAEADFLDRLEENFYPKALLDSLPYKQVVALVRGYLFVSKEELRPGDEAYGVELRLTPEGVRLLAGLLFTKLNPN